MKYMNLALEKLKFVPKFLVATNFLTMPSLNSKLFGALFLRNSFHSIFNIMKTKNSLTIVYIQLSSQNIARGCQLPCNQQFFAFATVPIRKKMIKIGFLKIFAFSTLRGWNGSTACSCFLLF